MNLICLVAWLASLAPTSLDLTFEPHVKGQAGEVELVFYDSAQNAEVLRQKAPVPWHGSLALERPATGLRLEVVSPNFWAAPLEIAAGSQAVALELFPRGELVFAEAPPAGKAVAQAEPGPIFVEIASSPVPNARNTLTKTRLSCRLEAERWHCPAPALVLDLRLEKMQHVPRYFFDTKVEAGKSLDLGQIRFERGASISGYVTVEEGEPTGATIAAILSGNWAAREAQRRELRKVEAVASARGFFQLLGMAPGGYRLEATRKGLTTTELWPVDVREEQETLLAQPLYLTRAAELEVHLSPPTGPLGMPWKLLLVREILGATGSDQTFAGTTDESGTFVWKEMRPGRYFLDVANPDGEKTGAGDDSIWLSQPLELTPGNQPLYLDIPVVAVEGTFKAGEDPVRGRLIFGGFHGAPHVAIWSDAEGRFSGQLPRQGEWDLDAEVDGRLMTLEKVSVEPRHGRPAHLDIRLADTRFHGKVLHKGKPVEGASLWGHSVGSGTPGRFDASTNEEGAFDLKGLAPGTYEVTVSSARLRLGAPKLRFEIREGAEDPAVTIELEEFVRISGQVLAGGQPVAMASFGAYLVANTGTDTRDGQSDITGVFGLLVPESTREIGLVVAAAGFAWQIVPLHPSITGSGFAPVLVEVYQNGGTLRLEGQEARRTRLFFGGVEVPVYLLAETLHAAGYFTDRGSQVTLENASPGPYRACRADHCVEGVLAPGGSLELDLGAEEGGSAAEKDSDPSNESPLP